MSAAGITYYGEDCTNRVSCFVHLHDSLSKHGDYDDIRFNTVGGHAHDILLSGAYLACSGSNALQNVVTASVVGDATAGMDIRAELNNYGE